MAASRAIPPLPSLMATPSATLSGTPSRVTAASRANPAAPVTDADEAGGVGRGRFRVQLFAAVVLLAVTLRHTVQPLADQGEDDCSDHQGARGAPDAALLVGLLEQLEGQRGDQRTGGERKHPREHALGEAQPPAREGTESQRS